MNVKESEKYVIFFDEINTNENVSGLLKEVMVDRLLEGELLDDRIIIIAACNPYKI